MEATRAIGKPKDGQKHGFGRQQDTLKHGFGRALAGARVSIFEKYYDPPVEGQDGGSLRTSGLPASGSFNRLATYPRSIRIRANQPDPFKAELSELVKTLWLTTTTPPHKQI